MFGKSNDKPDPQDIAEAGVQFLEVMESVILTLDGYRAKLIEHGYSEGAAEQMCVSLHHAMVFGVGK